MAMTKKIRVAVLYGGRSGEHEVSLKSAASVVRHLDRARFEVVPVSIDKSGLWQLNDLRPIEQADGESLTIQRDAPEVRLARTTDGQVALMRIADGAAPGALEIPGAPEVQAIDVVFPVMHGPLCEDGTIQGLLELADVAYVGSGRPRLRPQHGQGHRQAPRGSRRHPGRALPRPDPDRV